MLSQNQSLCGYFNKTDKQVVIQNKQLSFMNKRLEHKSEIFTKRYNHLPINNWLMKDIL